MHIMIYVLQHLKLIDNIRSENIGHKKKYEKLCARFFFTQEYWTRGDSKIYSQKYISNNFKKILIKKLIIYHHQLFVHTIW